LRQKSNFKTKIVNHISIFVDKPSTKSDEKITEVILKDNPRKFQGTERLRQRKRDILSNISNKNPILSNISNKNPTRE
jgi:hypothetical protein